MQYQVPQYIDVADKIVGPLTLRQFFYLAGAFVISFVLYFLFAIWLWLILTALLFAGAVALAFIKYNGRPLIIILRAAFNHYWQPRAYLWQKGGERPLPAGGRLSRLELQLKTASQPIAKREKGIFGRLFQRLRPPEEQFEILRKLTGEEEKARRVDYR